MKTMTVCGVEFDFHRIESVRSGSRKYWQVSVKKTGTVLECFPGQTLAKKIQSMQDTARIIGLERFKSETEAAS